MKYNVRLNVNNSKRETNVLMQHVWELNWIFIHFLPYDSDAILMRTQ